MRFAYLFFERRMFYEQHENIKSENVKQIMVQLSKIGLTKCKTGDIKYISSLERTFTNAQLQYSRT